MDERAKPRIVTNEDVAAASAGRCWHATMYNMSTAGCAIACDEFYLRAGDAVTLMIDEFSPIEGRVAWTRGNCAGFTFNDQVHADIVMYVGFRDSVDLSQAELRADQSNF